MDLHESYIALVEMTAGINEALKSRLEALQKLNDPPHVEVNLEEAEKTMSARFDHVCRAARCSICERR